MSYPRGLSKGGFSLIELIVSIAISGIALSAVTTTFVSQSQSYDVQEQIVEMQQNARAAMDIITREVRMAGFDPTGAGFTGVHYHSGYIHIRADLNGDGDKDDTNEDLRYRYDSTNKLIERDDDDWNNWTLLVENIQAFNFDYLDRNSNPTTTSTDIRQIQITINARTAERDVNYPLNDGYQTYRLTSLVTPRNLAY